MEFFFILADEKIINSDYITPRSHEIFNRRIFEHGSHRERHKVLKLTHLLTSDESNEKFFSPSRF
jgi:hypothetical protein